MLVTYSFVVKLVLLCESKFFIRHDVLCSVKSDILNLEFKSSTSHFLNFESIVTNYSLSHKAFSKSHTNSC